MSTQDEASNGTKQRNVRITFKRKQDRYCFYCEDGGLIMDCDVCDRGYCYNILEEVETTPKQAETPPESLPCVTVPREMKTDKRRIFRCPECLSQDKFSLPDYIINRGYRATRRLSIKSSVVLVLFYLKSLESIAESLIAQLCAALGVFELHVVTIVLKIEMEIEFQEAEQIRKQLLPDAPYHLAVLFLTESDPRGGWWVASENDRSGPGRADEQDFIEHHTATLTYLARDALSARLFPIACGMNMFNESSVSTIYHTINIRPWHSIVLPTAPSVLPWQYISIFPELFVHLYYFGSPLGSSLLRTWAKSPEARQHTGFVLMDRPTWWGTMHVSKLEHAPHTSRPLGFELPMIPSLCGCWGKLPHHWSANHVSEKFGELFYFFTSKCCSLELHIAIYKDNRTVFKAHGTTIMEEAWDLVEERFTFDPLTMVVVKRSPARGTEQYDERPTHDQLPWTKAGLRNYKP